MFTMSLPKDESGCVVRAVQMGIDAHLQAFTRSRFAWSARGFLDCEVEDEELELLLRRLLEDDDDGEAERLADDIVYVQFGVEPR